jgi:hypothetical protein
MVTNWFKQKVLPESLLGNSKQYLLNVTLQQDESK